MNRRGLKNIKNKLFSKSEFKNIVKENDCIWSGKNEIKKKKRRKKKMREDR